MLRYVLLRVASIPLVMFLVITIIFSLTHIVPGGAVQVALGPHATIERIEAIKAKYGLDKPLPVQYVNYIRNILRGNLGESIIRQKPVMSEIGIFIPASVELVLLATFLIVVIGVPLGVMAATRKDRFLDFVSRGIAIAGVSLPSFWLALMLLLAFSFGLHLLPSGGRIDPSVSPPAHITGMYLFDSLVTGNWTALANAILHIILPAFTLAITNISTTTRLTRDGMLKVFKEDFIAMAWAYGLSPRKIYFKYALKNAVLPALTNLGMTMAYLLGGDFIVETVFSFPGLGFYATMALLQVDYAPVAAVAIIISFLYLCTNLFVDLLYVLIDPRIKF
jgi:peptide/nickel transport system permease protein